MNRHALLWACLTGLSLSLLTACELPVRQPAQAPGVMSAPLKLKDLAGILEHMSLASPGELAREYEQLRTQQSTKQTGDRSLRLALLLAQPEMPFHDDAAALRGLQEWEMARQGVADPAVKAFVGWLRRQLGERIRLGAGLEEAAQKAREEKKRADAIKEKLEALKNMEKSLIERDNKH